MEKRNHAHDIDLPSERKFDDWNPVKVNKERCIYIYILSMEKAVVNKIMIMIIIIHTIWVYFRTERQFYSSMVSVSIYENAYGCTYDM